MLVDSFTTFNNQLGSKCSTAVLIGQMGFFQLKKKVVLSSSESKYN